MNKFERQKEIHAKGFGMGESLEFGRMKIGKKSFEDLSLSLSTLKQTNRNYNNKTAILKALANKDVNSLREVSDYFYRTNGIYFRICNYFAQMYRYDWYITPITYANKDKVKAEKLTGEFYSCLELLDGFDVKKTL